MTYIYTRLYKATNQTPKLCEVLNYTIYNKDYLTLFFAVSVDELDGLTLVPAELGFLLVSDVADFEVELPVELGAADFASVFFTGCAALLAAGAAGAPLPPPPPPPPPRLGAALTSAFSANSFTWKIRKK